MWLKLWVGEPKLWWEGLGRVQREGKSKSGKGDPCTFEVRMDKGKGKAARVPLPQRSQGFARETGTWPLG